VAFSHRFNDALILAHSLHRSQTRKGPEGAPYIAHLLQVAATVIEFGGTEDEAIAALLHDAVEDQGGATTRETIRRLFGEEVAAIVDGCTDSDEEPKPPWRERKERFLAGLARATPSVVLVTLADKLSNVRTTIRDLRGHGPGIWRRFRGGEKGSLWYYRAAVEASECSDKRVMGLRWELAGAVEELAELAREQEPSGGTG
jgi:GTP pyrophosphokinase